MDENSVPAAVPDVSRERRIVIAALVGVAVVAVLGFLLLRETPQPQASELQMRVTAYAQLSDTRLLVQYQQIPGGGPASVTADESGAPVVLRASLLGPEAGAKQRSWLSIGPLSTVVAEVDLAQPLGDRAVVDGSGARLPVQTEEELRSS
jgi:hypothetical protein